jgi:hypothetical protein
MIIRNTGDRVAPERQQSWAAFPSVSTSALRGRNMAQHYEWFREMENPTHGDVSQRISEILKSQGRPPSQTSIQDTIRACEKYHHRMWMETRKSTALAEMKKLQSLLKVLSYDTRVEL